MLKLVVLNMLIVCMDLELMVFYKKGNLEYEVKRVDGVEGFGFFEIVVDGEDVEVLEKIGVFLVECF